MLPQWLNGDLCGVNKWSGQTSGVDRETEFCFLVGEETDGVFHVTFFFPEDGIFRICGFLPDLTLAMVFGREDETSTHSRGEGLIGRIRGFIGMSCADLTMNCLLRG